MGGSRRNREHDGPGLAQPYDAEKLGANADAIAIVDIRSIELGFQKFLFCAGVLRRAGGCGSMAGRNGRGFDLQTVTEELK